MCTGAVSQESLGGCSWKQLQTFSLQLIVLWSPQLHPARPSLCQPGKFAVSIRAGFHLLAGLLSFPDLSAHKRQVSGQKVLSFWNGSNHLQPSPSSSSVLLAGDAWWLRSTNESSSACPLGLLKAMIVGSFNGECRKAADLYTQLYRRRSAAADQQDEGLRCLRRSR